jgi:hypothetical protein
MNFTPQKKEVLMSKSIITLLLATVAVIFLFAPELGVRQVFTYDFIQYWSAFRLSSMNANPYNESLMAEIQNSLGYHNAPIMMYIAPIILFIMSPVLWLPFSQAAYMWALINTAFIFIACSWIYKLYAKERISSNLIPVSIVVISNIAVINTIIFGQLGAIMCFCVAGMLNYHNNKNKILTAFFISLCSIKPHLVYLFIPAMFITKERSIDWALARWTVLWTIILFGFTSLLFPSAMSGYMQEVLNPISPMRQQTQAFRVATIVGQIRGWLFDFYGYDAPWLMYVIPCFALLVVVIYYIKFYKPENFLYVALPLLSISIFTCPYGWLFDQTILAKIPVAAIAAHAKFNYSKIKKVHILAVCFAVNMVGIIEAALFDRPHAFTFLPLLMITIWIVMFKRIKSETI